MFIRLYSSRLKVYRTLCLTACLNFKKVFEKDADRRKNSWLYLNSLLLAAIQFGFECLQGSARQWCFPLTNFKHLFIEADVGHCNCSISYNSSLFFWSRILIQIFSTLKLTQVIKRNSHCSSHRIEQLVQVTTQFQW